jgi:anaphase-promoting complex subunit 8
MTLVFHLYASQQLYQWNDHVHKQLADLEGLFPGNQFIMTQRALIYYHAKGKISWVVDFEPRSYHF